ncbi:MAG TPA: cytochrome bc complex cytochrome b subunit [Gammaproteobacteria bacterium]|nr:cytochrome bc complex cytochrome b subunit [Gammaproteobacteria bacterium]
MSGEPQYRPQAGRKSAFMTWIDERLPVTSFWNKHVGQYYAPKNFNFWYFFGSLALLVLVNQILTGIFLTMNYKPSAADAFASIQYIMRDVHWGWLIRYMHTTGASAFFVVIYLHMFRGLMYGSYKKPRELIWIFGMFIYLALMAEAFFGYLLPWGQMSYWGAQVITSLFGAIPGIGNGLMTWIRGDFYVSDVTLNRFFAFHVIALPLVLIGLVLFHLSALHESGSNNPDGVEIKKHKDAHGIPLDGIPFHPYYTVKDSYGVMVFMLIFAAIVFFAPTVNGLFIEVDNFQPANPAQTPSDIHPVWYFTPFYSILRSIPSKLGGVTAMGLSIALLFFMPWLDKNPIKSLRYRGILYKALLIVFALSFLVLGYIGMQHASQFWAKMGQRFGEIYFMFFAVSWLYSKPRAISTYVAWFLVLLGMITAYDVFNYNPAVGAATIASWFIPAIYGVIFFLLPAFTRLNEPKPVPERVTRVTH